MKTFSTYIKNGGSSADRPAGGLLRRPSSSGPGPSTGARNQPRGSRRPFRNDCPAPKTVASPRNPGGMEGNGVGQDALQREGAVHARAVSLGHDRRWRGGRRPHQADWSLAGRRQLCTKSESQSAPDHRPRLGCRTLYRGVQESGQGLERPVLDCTCSPAGSSMPGASG